MARLGDICEKITDYVASGSFAALKENVLITNEPNYAIMVKTADFSNGFTKNLTYTDKRGYDFLHNSNLFGGELILSNIGSIGKVFKVPYLRRPMTLASNTVMLKTKDDLLTDYLFHFFQSEAGYKKLMSISSGTSMLKFNKTELKNIDVPYPDRETQMKTVSNMDKLNHLISLRKKQLQKLDDLVKSRFVEMFGDTKSNPFGFERRPLRETCTVITGNTPSRSVPEYYGDSIEWIKTDNIVAGQLNPSQAIEYLSDEGARVGRTVDDGAILMACIAGSVASIGRVCITDRKVAFNQQINAILPKDYDSLFLHAMLQLSKEYLVEEVNMALKGILSKSKLESKEFIVPPMNQQKEFAAFVTRVDKSKLTVQQGLDKLELLKQSLMQKYFG